MSWYNHGGKGSVLREKGGRGQTKGRIDFSSAADTFYLSISHIETLCHSAWGLIFLLSSRCDRNMTRVRGLWVRQPHTHTNTQVLLRKCWDLTNPLYNNIIFLISGRKYVGAVNRLQIFKRLSYMICGLLIAMNGITIMTTLKILLGCYWKWQCIWWTRSAMLLIIAALEQVWA